MSCKKSAFILGARTPIGRQLIEAVNSCSEFNSVVLMGQRAVDNLPVTSKLVQRIINYEKLEEFAEEFENIDAGFCVLGTARTKSEADGFFNRDCDNIINIAKLAKDKGTTCFVFVSMKNTPGCLENSMEIEEELVKLEFQKTVILRPGALTETDGGKHPQGLENELDQNMDDEKKPEKNSLSCRDVARAMVVAFLDSNITGKVTWNSQKIIEKALKLSL